MKVLVSTFGGDGGKSGISQYIMHLMKEFPRVAPDVQFDVLAFEGEEHLYVTDPERIKVITVGKHLSNPMKNLAWQQFAIPRLCAKGKYDVFFVPAGNRRMPYWVPCPSMGTFHDLAILHVPGKYDWLHKIYNLHVLPMLVRRLTRITADSECSKRDLVEYVHVPEERITVVPLAADSGIYHPRDKAACQRRIGEQYKFDQPYVLCIARIEHPGKNHARLIRAFSRLKERESIPHKLVLAGSDWHGADEVHREAAACSAAKDIIFTGFVAQEIIPDLYRGADAFVFPSLFEGFGLPVLEAMSSGVPVACSNTSSLPEVAGDAALMFDPLDEGAIEEALRVILLDGTEREKCVERGLFQSGKFSWKKTAEQTIEALRAAIREGK